jgi:hypothetical protein
MAEPAASEELGAIEAGDADGFLPAVLERVEAERADRGRLVRADYAKDTALFAQLVAVEINERMCDVHEPLRDRQPRGSNGD